jgi:hypothetical protein
VNISHEGGSIVTFVDARRSRKEPFDPSAGLAPEWLDYCRLRERMERAAAKRAGSPQSRRIHQELAQAYARTLTEAAERGHE